MPTASTTVLIADDHRIVRDGLRTVLQGARDIEVVGEAENGRETVRLVQGLEPDVVIMDVAMPDLNGIEATRRIGDLGFGTKVLALSMHADCRYVKGMLGAGAVGYMLKDCAAEELATAIRTVICNRLYVSPGIAGVIVRDYVHFLSGPWKSPTRALTDREREVLQLVAEGNAAREIGRRMNVSIETAKTYRRRLMEKLDLHSVAALTKYAIREGITSLDD